MSSDELSAWRVALASYDPRELRVWSRYLEECNPTVRCTGYRDSTALMGRLKKGDVDVLVLGGRLEDMDGLEFLRLMRDLAHKPLVLLRDDGRNEQAAVQSLNRDDVCYMIRQATLEEMLQELRAPRPQRQESLEKRCERLYRSWGIEPYDVGGRYLTGAVRVMLAADHRLAIRKEILQKVAEENNVTVAAVDSSLRRLLDMLDEQDRPGWKDFKTAYGLEYRKVTISRLLYALEHKMSRRNEK